MSRNRAAGMPSPAQPENLNGVRWSMRAVCGVHLPLQGAASDSKASPCAGVGVDGGNQ